MIYINIHQWIKEMMTNQQQTIIFSVILRRSNFKHFIIIKLKVSLHLHLQVNGEIRIQSPEITLFKCHLHLVQANN